MIFASGDIYEGYWDSNAYNGQGRFISFSGVVYEGGMVRG